ncbi:hypothetical protein EJ05DRAFT_490751 [Pseudovirgaria hyperparasitica]|uniref:Uncharacterized protein n=1 Tax=Pseudovirgaria hyperparasitica TaxID=470096 RepID=A0A6A6VPU1_9PEZI|nr:uncharacterized protein EJ05DRAFT_490751 [Pseudovirgaria hyperparasitica]KAF2752642.1 hypothetical protein EJ05DRAFT_490751 [Pseudovirgaria hyperparasitica]
MFSSTLAQDAGASFTRSSDFRFHQTDQQRSRNWSLSTGRNIFLSQLQFPSWQGGSRNEERSFGESRLQSSQDLPEAPSSIEQAIPLLCVPSGTQGVNGRNGIAHNRAIPQAHGAIDSFALSNTGLDVEAGDNGSVRGAQGFPHGPFSSAEVLSH